jgi:hypothetical protein
MAPRHARTGVAERVNGRRLCDTAPNARVIRVTVAIRRFSENHVNTFLYTEFSAPP